MIIQLKLSLYSGHFLQNLELIQFIGHFKSLTRNIGQKRLQIWVIPRSRVPNAGVTNDRNAQLESLITPES